VHDSLPASAIATSHTTSETVTTGPAIVTTPRPGLEPIRAVPTRPDGDAPTDARAVNHTTAPARPEPKPISTRAEQRDAAPAVASEQASGQAAARADTARPEAPARPAARPAARGAAAQPQDTTTPVATGDAARTAEFARGGQAVAAPAGIDSAVLRERVERVIALQEAIAARPATSVLLELEDAGDPFARVRIDLRGSALDTSFDVRDPSLAAALRADLPELHRALERRGFDPANDPLRALAGAITEAPASSRSPAEQQQRSFSGDPSRQQQSQDRPQGQPQRRHDERPDEEEK
jgi:hypothetical protein